MSADVLSNTEARRVLEALSDRGVSLIVRRGMLATTHPMLLTEEDRAAIAFHKPALILLVLITDARMLDRLLAMHQRGHRSGLCLELGRCHTCGDALPGRRPIGPVDQRRRRGLPLRFDQAVPA